MVFAALTWAVYGLAQKQLLLKLPSQAIMLCILRRLHAGLPAAVEPGRLSGTLGPVATRWRSSSARSTRSLGYGAFSEALVHWEASRVSSVLALTPLGTSGVLLVAGRPSSRRVGSRARADLVRRRWSAQASSWAGSLLVSPSAGDGTAQA